MKCPECNEDIITYGRLYLHPLNDCKINDGCEITVYNRMNQDNFKTIVELNEEKTNQTEPEQSSKLRSVFKKIRIFKNN
jgi:hypothetical protein